MHLHSRAPSIAAIDMRTKWLHAKRMTGAESNRSTSTQSLETTDSQKERIEQRRRLLAERKAKIEAAKAGTPSPKSVKSAASTTESQRERMEQRRRELVTNAGDTCTLGYDGGDLSTVQPFPKPAKVSFDS